HSATVSSRSARSNTPPPCFVTSGSGDDDRCLIACARLPCASDGERRTADREGVHHVPVTSGHVVTTSVAGCAVRGASEGVAERRAQTSPPVCCHIKGYARLSKTQADNEPI